MDPRATGFSGSVIIALRLAKASEVVWLHGLGLQVDAVVARLADGRELTGHYEQVLESGVSVLRFKEALPAGPLSVKIIYSADYDRNLAGLFKVEEQGDAYVLAKSESIQARRFLPGFDEPGMKAVFEVQFTVPAGHEVITNSPLVERHTLPSGLEKLRFAPTRPMSTYLLSLAVGPFDRVERPPIPPNAWRAEPLPLRGFARRGRGADMGYILDTTPGMVEAFESQLQRPYPYAKLDIVAAPQWPSGATELSAAITYREQRILVGDNPAPGARLALVSVHAHELAHMWFGNVVTPPWWDDLWLKEGFATWGTPLALTLLEPEAGHEVTAAANAIIAMRLDSLASTRAIREPIIDNLNVRNAYDAITYRKSLGVIHMVDQYFGPAVFRPALGRYIGAFTDRSADSPQFYDIIGRETKTPELTETFRSFVEQKGVPLLRAELRCDTNPMVLLQQERYRPLGSLIAEDKTRWTVPLCVRDNTGARYCDILRAKSVALKLGSACPDWVLPNAGGAGYYRWTLPEAQWSALLDDFEGLEDTEALSMVDSVIAGFEAGELSPALLLRVIKVSARQSRRQVVTAPLEALERYVASYFNDEQRSALAQRIGPWYGEALERALASDNDPDMQLLASELRGFMARVLRMPGIRAGLSKQAAVFTGFGGERNPDALSSDLYRDALTVAVQDLGEGFLRHLIELRQRLDDPKFEGASAEAIGGVDDPALLPLVHQQVLAVSMGARESFGLLRSATTTDPVAEANWAWLVENFAAVAEKIPAQWRRRLPQMGSGFCSEQGLAKLQAQFGHQGELTPGYQRSLDQTAESIALCIALRSQGEALAVAL